NIFKGLWPIWTLFILSFFVLVPLSIYIFNGLNNAQIAAAKEAQLDAEERVNSAYQEQLSRVKKELEGEWDSFHKQKNQVLERESAIQNREHTAQQIEKSAKERVDNIVEQYNQEKDRFEAEMLDMARARDNAQAGYKRIKMKLDRKKNLSF
ncbi:hypothetical protein P3709_25150, partial [Vibrio parahaemolyticus]|nr:hypothetical protein [Vibrio parahaemolyticus]